MTKDKLPTWGDQLEDLKNGKYPAPKLRHVLTADSNDVNSATSREGVAPSTGSEQISNANDNIHLLSMLKGAK